MVSVEHKQTRVIVTFLGSVTEASVIELVDTINLLRSDYFYRQIDLRIASPGGEVIALDYFIEALSHWKRQDLTVTTRALTSCSSAAAIMLALGYHREASSSSILLYHYSRISMEHHGPMTSDSAEEVSERLKNVDDRMRARLVDRVVSRGVFDGPKNTTELGDLDRAALRDIRVAWSAQARELMSDGDDEAWLDAWIERTRETSDEKELRNRWSRLYNALLVEDRPISAVLAVRLGLVDQLVDSDPHGRGGSVPGSAARWFEIPEWSAAFPGGKVGEQELRRHTLILGETGSGKTRSAILPVLAATYRSPRVGVGLVIDPKHELDGVLRKWNCSEGEGRNKRLKRITRGEVAIELMPSSSETWSIRKMIREYAYWSAAERILRRVATITASNPARVLLGEPPTDRDAYWSQEGTTLVTTVLAVAIHLLRHPDLDACVGYEDDASDEIIPARAAAMNRLWGIGVRLGLCGRGREEQVNQAVESARGEASHSPEEERDGSIGPPEVEQRKRIRRDRAMTNLMKNLEDVGLSSMERRMRTSIAKKWDESGKEEGDFDAMLDQVENMLSRSPEDGIPNVFAVASMIHDELFPMKEKGSYASNPDVYTPLHALADMMEEQSRGEFGLIARRIRSYADMRGGADKQYAGVFGAGSTVWREMISKEIRNTLYFGCEAPNRNRAGSERLHLLDFTRDTERTMRDLEEEPGVLYVYQPDLHGLDNLVAKACKVLFFEAVLGSGERVRNGDEMPLAAYVADEFQRFITADRVHGEQSFFDVCRSFGAFAVVACQSIASLRYALASFEPNEYKRRSAIDIICNNTATKIFFRTTDQDTFERVNTICPATTGGALVTQVRPLSTLGVGECYASFPDGRFERIQLEEFGGGG